MADTEDVDTLKRRGRRRLVGAIALVLVAVIVLPMIFDSEPRQAPPPVSVRILSEEDGAFTPKVTPGGPEKAEAKAPEKPPAAKGPEKAPERIAEKPAEKAQEKPSPPKAEPRPAPAVDEAERRRAEAALAGGGGFVVQVGAFAEAEKVQDVTRQLASSKLPFRHYTEQVPTAKGPVTRVRVGPFATREDAESAVKRLGEIGLKGGRVVAGS